jgi:hypothetical protein
MLLHAIFWIGFILVMIPHAPNIDLGRPATSVEALSQLHA